MRSKARNQAIHDRRMTFSTGKPCRRGHMSERYTSNGGCVECAHWAAEAQREEIRAARWAGGEVAARMERKLAKEAVMKRGGPNSMAEARAHRIAWFNQRTTCGHEVVSVRMFPRCQLCADGVMHGISKEALDLLA